MNDRNFYGGCGHLLFVCYFSFLPSENVTITQLNVARLAEMFSFDFLENSLETVTFVQL